MGEDYFKINWQTRRSVEGRAGLSFEKITLRHYNYTTSKKARNYLLVDNWFLISSLFFLIKEFAKAGELVGQDLARK